MFLIRYYLLSLLVVAMPGMASMQTEQSPVKQLQAKINALLQQQNDPAMQEHIVQTATILTPADQIQALCDNPRLRLAGNDSRLTGKKSVIAQCGARKHFLQVRVEAEGTWWVTKTALPAGTVIGYDDIEAKTGSLAGEPAGLVFNPAEITGQTLVRGIGAGQPLLKNQLRAVWLVLAGQPVEIIASGKGFRVLTQGKALGNAAANDTLKVKTRSGQTISGQVKPDGRVMINL